MERVVAQVLALEENYPAAAAGANGIIIIIAADVTAITRMRFSGYPSRIGNRCVELDIPNKVGGEGAQQASYMGIPLFMFDGLSLKHQIM
jgi:hypothetical protein